VLAVPAGKFLELKSFNDLGHADIVCADIGGLSIRR
jgi:hypothetical protein